MKIHGAFQQWFKTDDHLSPPDFMAVKYSISVLQHKSVLQPKESFVTLSEIPI